MTASKHRRRAAILKSGHSKSGRTASERAWLISDGRHNKRDLLGAIATRLGHSYPLLMSLAVVVTVVQTLRTPDKSFRTAETQTVAVIDEEMRERAMPSGEFEYALAPEPDSFVVPNFSPPLTASGVAETQPESTQASLVQPSIPREAPTAQTAVQTKARIAIVVDDMGMRRNMTRRFAEIDAPLTFSFLPYAEGLDWQTRLIAQTGHELMLHLPMEPYANGEGGENEDPGPQALMTNLPAMEARARITWNLSRFEGFRGVNNHMGSRYTEDAGAMRLVIDALARQNLYFLDSRTSPDSVGADLARDAGISWQVRDVFIDNVREKDAVLAQLREAERIALAQGSAIAIGHPHGVTLEALQAWIPTLAAKGIELVPASVLMRRGDGDVPQPPRQRVAATRTGAGSTADGSFETGGQLNR